MSAAEIIEREIARAGGRVQAEDITAALSERGYVIVRPYDLPSWWPFATGSFLLDSQEPRKAHSHE